MMAVEDLPKISENIKSTLQLPTVKHFEMYFSKRNTNTDKGIIRKEYEYPYLE